ncbi:MAG: hypothetical protein EP338_02465 [Bacteroidetes bacterium]|nr:MAG: hypothetical protein EP338_02465 [Bacteroidota bacterium]
MSMKFYWGVLCVFCLGILSCEEKEKQNLDPEQKKKVVLLQVDYHDYKFNSGKEFSYFIDQSSGTELPVDTIIQTSISSKRITMLYGDAKDTIFDGTQIDQGGGKRIYPAYMDNHIFYYYNEKGLDRPDSSNFQLVFNDYEPESIPYDSIWKNIARLQIVEQYRQKRPDSKIGLFLFRPNGDPVPKTDWKWFVIFRD